MVVNLHPATSDDRWEEIFIGVVEMKVGVSFITKAGL
jgi:hypothetical protein